MLSGLLTFSPDSGMTYRALIAAKRMILTKRIGADTCVSLRLMTHRMVGGVKCAGNRCVFRDGSYNMFSTVRRRDTSVGHNMRHRSPVGRNTNSRKVVFNCTAGRARGCVPLSLSLTRHVLLILTSVHHRKGRVACLHPSTGDRIAVRCSSGNGPIHVSAVIMSARRSSFVRPTSSSTRTRLGTSRRVLTVVHGSIVRVLVPHIVTSVRRTSMLTLFGSGVVCRIGPANGFIVNNPRNSANLAKHGVVMSACNNGNTRNNNTFSNGSPDGMSHDTTCTTHRVTGGLITTNITSRVLMRISCTVNITHPVGVCMSACKHDGIGVDSNRVTGGVSRLFSLHPGTVRRHLGLHGPVCDRATTCKRVKHRPHMMAGAFSSHCRPAGAVRMRLFA